MLPLLDQEQISLMIGADLQIRIWDSNNFVEHDKFLLQSFLFSTKRNTMMVTCINFPKAKGAEIINSVHHDQVKTKERSLTQELIIDLLLSYL